MSAVALGGASPAGQAATSSSPAAPAATYTMPLNARRLIARARAGALANRLGFAVGLVFGVLLVLARVHEYDTIHNMLMLRDPYVFLLMGSAVGTALPLVWLLQRRRWQTPFGGQLETERPALEPRHIAGSVVFGTGWAITGACPGPVLAMTASGNLLGFVVVAGIFAGSLARDWVAKRQGLEESATC